jgi:hypothetical protein
MNARADPSKDASKPKPSVTKRAGLPETMKEHAKQHNHRWRGSQGSVRTLLASASD